MSKQVRVSAFIDASTKALLDRHARATGVTKGHLIEEALRHYLLALSQLSLDVVVRPRIVLTRASGKVVNDPMRTAKPTKVLRALMRSGKPRAGRSGRKSSGSDPSNP